MKGLVSGLLVTTLCAGLVWSQQARQAQNVDLHPIVQSIRGGSNDSVVVVFENDKSEVKVFPDGGFSPVRLSWWSLRAAIREVTVVGRKMVEFQPEAAGVRPVLIDPRGTVTFLEKDGRTWTTLTIDGSQYSTWDGGQTMAMAQMDGANMKQQTLYCQRSEDNQTYEEYIKKCQRDWEQLKHPSKKLRQLTTQTMIQRRYYIDQNGRIIGSAP